MGEKRKARLVNNERTAKKEKKTVDTVILTAINDEIEESSSVQSNGSTTDSTSQQPSTTKENTNPEDMEESETIAPIDGVELENEENGETKPSTNGDADADDEDNDNKLANESVPPTKSWWSSLIHLFHFRNNTNENKPEINESSDHPSSPYLNGSYLSNVKCRRSLHDESLVS
ncbi:unnamed protein product [Rotaria socialis]|uniref:Uncharacterized protein n=1 Tax=Rotaria socialis TaxID=392032 RepID=A0A817VF74_9BILA|nr:unnamed protein product [Rotaria socialis]CAF3398612.1 unnamed protein product [Rotaria socialis]CAF4254438.1 unnamed protein product [Rotaria socialis]CAF4325050.1 unnamed protein product [Rotaria socialis]